MKKAVLLLSALFFLVFPLFAFSVRSSLKGSFFLPQKTTGLSDSFEFRFSSKNVHLDPYCGARYSIRYYNEGGSKALIYGPLLRFGLSFNSEMKDLCFQLCAGIEGVYANFPTIAFANLEFGVIYRGLKACAGVLLAENDLSFELALV